MHISWSTTKKGGVLRRDTITRHGLCSIHISTVTLYLLRNGTYLHSDSSWLLQVESGSGSCVLVPGNLLVGRGGHKLTWMDGDQTLVFSEVVDRRYTVSYQLSELIKSRFYMNAP